MTTEPTELDAQLAEQNSTSSVQADEAEFDRRIVEQLAQSSASLGWVDMPDDEPTPVAVRGATDELRNMAALLISTGTRKRTLATPEAKKSAEVLRKLVGVEGYRLKIREGLFPTDGENSPKALFLVIQAIKRNSGDNAA